MFFLFRASRHTALKCSQISPFPTSLHRSKFSVQVRDFVDLVVTRLSDLKSQEKTKRYKGADIGYDRAMGVEGPTDRETSHLGGDCSDPAVREVGERVTVFAGLRVFHVWKSGMDTCNR